MPNKKSWYHTTLKDKKNLVTEILLLKANFHSCSETYIIRNNNEKKPLVENVGLQKDKHGKRKENVIHPLPLDFVINIEMNDELIAESTRHSRRINQCS